MEEQLCPTTGGSSILAPSLHIPEPEQAVVQHGEQSKSDDYSFRAISKQEAKALIIAHHYKHRPCPISWAYGIECPSTEGKQAEVVGCLTVGKPASWSATFGLVGEKYSKPIPENSRSRDVFELNRLWLHDSLPHCMESRFIGWCLRQLKREHPNVILLSYAEQSVGHVGTVYQATNWIYTGESARFTDITLQGYSDYRSVPMEKRGEKIGNKRAWANDPTAIRVERGRKHRYVWFANPDDRKLLAWSVHPYPKRVQ